MNLQLPMTHVRPKALRDAVHALSVEAGVAERGAVFTKPNIVEAILDLCGYTETQPLHQMRFLEPSFGEGNFLVVAIDRLIAAFLRFGGTLATAGALKHAVRGVELHTATFTKTRSVVTERLVDHGIASDVAQDLANAWLLNDDFLLADIGGVFHVVAGNPPYVRQERIPDTLIKAYKRTFKTFYDRADLYVLFYERGLDLLSPQGVLGYICANRWLKNKYGGPLRKKVADGFRFKFFVDLERADVFDTDVIAYPAITVFQRGEAGTTLVALENRHAASGLNHVVESMLRWETGSESAAVAAVAAVPIVPIERDPWLLDAPGILTLLRRVEMIFPTLEESGAKVGIGVATGADRVFIGAYGALPVEEERKLKLAMAADCVDGGVAWGGNGLVNPYTRSGELAAFDEAPKFAAYMELHREALQRRHTAKKQPTKWYKTIDRVYPDLVECPKLLIPDIKGEATVSYDPGNYYPHHNLYVITSKTWNLQALQTILRSSVALMFVAGYCVRMAGGFLRFQAQYLRRIRVPDPETLTAEQVATLLAVSRSDDQLAVDHAVFPLYGLDAEDCDAVRAFAAAARVPRKTK